MDKKLVSEKTNKLSQPHMRPLADLVKKLRKRYPESKGLFVPDFDPDDGGINAKRLFVFQTPGPMTDPKKGGSGFVSQDNNDPTARATKKFLSDAGIERKDIVLWNIYCAAGMKETGEKYAWEEDIQELLKILKNVKSIVLVGKKAWMIEEKIDLTKYQVLRSFHPGQRVKNRYPDKWKQIPKVWRKVHDCNCQCD